MQFFFRNSNVFGTCIIHILYTGVLKLKNKSGAKRLNSVNIVRADMTHTMVSNGKDRSVLYDVAPGRVLRGI